MLIFCHDVLHASSIPLHKGKEPHRLVKLFSYSKTSDAILRYAFRRYFLTVSGDRFISNATCTQERPRTSHSTRHAISSGGSSKDRIYATARRGAIEDNCARIARCCLSMLCAGACRALTRGETLQASRPFSFLPESGTNHFMALRMYAVRYSPHALCVAGPNELSTSSL